MDKSCPKYTDEKQKRLIMELKKLVFKVAKKKVDRKNLRYLKKWE